MNITDDAALWYETQGAQIQDYEVPESPIEPTDTDPTTDEPETVDAETVEQRANLIEYNKPISETIVFLMDVILPSLCVLLIKGTQGDDLKLEPQEHAQLVNAWSLYLAGKEVQVSPGAALVVTIATVYGTKIAIALQNRKADEERQALKADVERLHEEIRIREEERQALKAELRKAEEEKKHAN